MKITRPSRLGRARQPRFLVLGGDPASATITVNTTADEQNNDGDCSLREAVESVNTGVAVDACGAATPPVMLPAGTYQLDSTLPVNVSNTITGAGSATTTINVAPAASIGIDVGSGASLTMQGVSMTGGPDYYVNAGFGAGTIDLSDMIRHHRPTTASTPATALSSRTASSSTDPAAMASTTTAAA